MAAAPLLLNHRAMFSLLTKSASLTALAAFVTLLLAAPALSQRPNAPNAPRRNAPWPPAARERVRRAVEAVGLIFVRNASDSATPRPRGSGVIVRGDGVLAT